MINGQMAERSGCCYHAINRLKVARAELDLAIEALEVACDELGSRRPMIQAEASVDVVASIARGVQDEIDACLARTK